MRERGCWYLNLGSILVGEAAETRRPASPGEARCPEARSPVEPRRPTSPGEAADSRDTESTAGEKVKEDRKKSIFFHSENI